MSEWGSNYNPNVWTPDDAGCVFDSHRGRYIFPAIVELAEKYGFTFDVELMKGEPDTDEMIELSCVAERFLNDTVATEGYSFGWHDGDYMYSSNEYWSAYDE